MNCYVCERVECSNPASWQVGLKLWGELTPPNARTEFNCVHIVTPLLICDECRDDTHPNMILVPEIRNALDQLEFANGGGGIDIDTAVMDWIELIEDPLDPEDTDEVVANLYDRIFPDGH